MPQLLTKPFMTRRERFIIATLQELTQQECPILTCSSAGSHARVIPKKRISRKIETNGMGKGKDFGKFGIIF